MRRRQYAIGAEQAHERWNARTPGARENLTVQCQLVTPMYGGGVRAGEVDRVLPIRTSGIRGQLRFWWRLLYGGDRDPADVFKDERAIWGGISAIGPSQASQVAIRTDCKSVDDRQLIDAKHPDVPNYGLIDHNEPTKLLKQGYAFEVALAFRPGLCDKKRNQVVEALRWWASFSGLGARTRRGFGAVNCAGVEPVTANDVEGRQGRMVVGGGSYSHALAAWRSAIALLWSFRQEPGIGRGEGGGGNRPGRSHWPEADTIRRIAGRSAHEPQHPVDGVYPRAAFGLPIVFHFKDSGDPSDTLEAADLRDRARDRMASPLILRPYFDGEAYRSMALLLPGWEQRLSVDVALKQRRKAARAWPKLDEEDKRKQMAAQIKPMKGRGNDVLSAFMSYFEEHQTEPLPRSGGSS